MAKLDYYRILEVIPEASPDVIKAAWRTLMQKHHPDHGGDERKAAAVIEAYEVLSDPKKRFEYDRDRNARVPNKVGNYQILEMIAEGGFGKTYKAQHILTGEFVCIKHCNRISPADEALLLQEAKTIWDLRHFSIPVVRDVIKLEDGSLALVMSYIPGPTLEKIIDKHGKMDPEHIAWITERLINVLKYLHYNGTVHGDVKPQNVILQNENHTVVLVDYGLSLVKPTSTSATAGYTALFAPPEQLSGMPIIPESDFYSLGMTLIYGLTGGNLDRVERKEVPGATPKPLTDFIRRLVVDDVLRRPNWEKEDLAETISIVREESFGRRRSNMKPLKY